MHPLRTALPCFALLCSLAGPVRAQCEPTWGVANPPPQLSGAILCSAQWDPDGSGPAAAQIVVGGGGLNGGFLPASSRIGVWNGTHWNSLSGGPGLTGTVKALAVWNGFLVAGGDFAGGGVDRIALWNGTAWQPIGAGLPNPVSHLAVWNNQLAAVASPFVQVWNGSTWSASPAIPNALIVNAMTVYQGSVCLGGSVPVSSLTGTIERWNGTAWAPSVYCNNSSPGQGIRTLAVRTNLAVGGAPVLYAGGDFTSIGGFTATGIASTSGGTSFAWSPVGGNTQNGCNSLVARNLISGFTIVGGFQNTATRLYSSASGTWTTIGPAMSSLLYFGGNYHGSRSLSTGAWHRYDGSVWQPVLGAGLQGQVRAIVPSGNDVIVGGAILATTGTPLDNIARWDGSTFQPLGTGIFGSSVDALCRLANGDVVAGGVFASAGGTPASNIARWNGSTWSALGAGTNQQVLALCELPNGEIIAGGTFTMAGGVACNRIARWNGTAWSPFNFGLNGDVLAVAVRSDGTLFAAGAFTAAGATPCNRIAQWNGASWQPLGTGCNADVHALAFRPNGDLVAVGAFTTAGSVAADRCAVWNGTTWASTSSTSMDPAAARSVYVLPNGDVVAGRGFAPGAASPDAGIARWNGSTWSGFGSGLAATSIGVAVDVRAIAQRADGAIVVGGTFGFASGLPTRGLATLTPTCPPSVASYGTGCSSTAGPLVITADALPWIGSTFRTTTTGTAPGSLCLGAIGLSPTNIPLATLLPEGQPGCSLLASPDILVTLATGAGNSAQSQFVLPDTTTLVGATFVQQTIPLEFGGSGLAAVRGSNGLSLTIGML